MVRTYNFISHAKRYVLYISTSHRMFAVPGVAVFCSFLMFCFPRMLVRNFLCDFEMFLVASVVAGIRFAFKLLLLLLLLLLKRTTIP